MAFISGPYAVTYGGVALGVLQDGFGVEVTFEGEDIVGDNFGDTVQDTIYRGGNCFVDMVLQEADKGDNLSDAGTYGAQKSFWPWHTGPASNGENFELGQIGRLAKALSAALVCTPYAGTSAASITDRDVYTFGAAIIAPGFNIRQLFAARLRQIPLRFRCYPSGSHAHTQEFFTVS